MTDKDADIAKNTNPIRTIPPQIRYGESVERKPKFRPSILISNGRIIGEAIMTTTKANFVFSYPSLYCTGRYTPIKRAVTRNMSANIVMSAVSNPGITKVSIPKAIQQIT